ncbi:hypothetical protein [Teredinibacter turnerae]|uniref:hypothetical protein n=1 Tax=Teredinibacter turnerae TaxID=2426 RepID=UPI0030D5C46D
MKLWATSIGVTCLLVVTLVLQWHEMDKYDINKAQQLTNMTEVTRYLEGNHSDLMADPAGERIITGLFIQSLKFFDSSEVNITGYIWQHFPLARYAGIPDSEISADFILPEQVNSGSDISPTLTYREKSNYGEVLGWYFEATLKQGFDYSHYPFDHKTVWIRLWPKAFSKNVVLVPDFSAYKSTSMDAIFGIEQGIVLGAWTRANTYFNYQTSSYDTNFGIPNYVGQTDFPELYYNFVIKRRFDNAFTVHLLPLFLVAVLLFAALLTTSEEHEKSGLLGFNISGFLGMCSALFFVVLIAHIQLREQFAGAGVVYLEYYYIVMYVVLVASTVNTYLFAIRPRAIEKWITYKDNIIPKVCYWPSIMIALNLITLFFL